MGTIKILKTIKRLPGGIMVVPLLLGAIINTFCPNILKIGSFTTALFSNTAVPTLVGIQIFCIGTSLKIKQAPEVLKRGGVLLICKWVAGALLGFIVYKIFGKSGVLGVSVLAIICAVTGANGSLNLALMGEYGEAQDQAAQSIENIHDGPFVALLTLGATGLANIPLVSLLAAIVPLLLGFILANLDYDFTDMFKSGVSILIPFIGFALGAGINFNNVLRAGFSGIVLALMVLIIGGGFAILGDKFINRRPGYAGASIASAAGNTMASPAAVALIDPSYKPYVASATIQIGAAVIITAIVVPFLVDWIAKKYGCPKFDREKSAQREELV
ncbi:2-keto-3-deoxygluconate permease [Clostridium sp. HV4-5-A1G]|uniref:2-keto-3-deoxygluconate permease n=1 Tax=Clostridium sp. HV4-5-A1G TaxID=2004595 RepID=UPI00168640E6|nr:2-keto-3-deoxygluconate permease [Clostridium sp. HV4-5-A1G]